MRSRSLIPILLLTACGEMTSAGGGDFGATPGGVKDMRFARELIALGQIPPPEALLVEGMFAEHDLGLTGATCADVLCLRAAGGVAPDRAGSPRGWLQVGMSSSIDPETWQRPATTFIYVVDVSGSMGWGGATTPGELSRDLMHQLTDQLRPDDEVAIVTYGSDVRLELPMQSGADLAPVHAAVAGLSENGSTNMEAGMNLAYAIGRDAVERGRDNVRLVLFTDVQPNVGATGGSEFETMVAAGAEDDVDLTVLALGTGIGPEVLERMSHLRGANAFTLFSEDDVDQFFVNEYPWFTTPIAYDLRVDVAAADGLSIADAYGFPGDFAEEPSLAVSTVFLSRRRGALLLSLEGPLDAMAADLVLGYTTAEGVDRTTTLRVDRDGAPLDERGHWYQQPTVARTVALALLVSGMREAAEQYQNDPAFAESIMQLADDRFAADVAVIEGGVADETLDREVALSAAMLQLIVERAPQGTLYGEDY